MEVILVDDGSPDHCPKLCDEWAEKDTRIKVIHQENKGLSGARNAGIDIAQGDYLTFVDSDDFLALNTYQPLLALLAQHPEYDILEYPIAGRLPLKQKTYGDMKAYWLEGEAYRHTYACNKIYKRSLFKNIRFPIGKLFEDVYTLPQLLRIATTIATTDVGCYHYCYNPNGITAQADGNALAQLLQAHLQSGMPIDDIYYLHLANIQSDVWERTKYPILLPTRKLDVRLFHGKEKDREPRSSICPLSFSNLSYPVCAPLLIQQLLQQVLLLQIVLLLLGRLLMRKLHGICNTRQTAASGARQSLLAPLRRMTSPVWLRIRCTM